MTKAQHSYWHGVIHKCWFCLQRGWRGWQVGLNFWLINLILGSVGCGYSTENVASPNYLLPGAGFRSRNHYATTQFKTYFIFSLNINNIIKYGSPV